MDAPTGSHEQRREPRPVLRTPDGMRGRVGCSWKLEPELKAMGVNLVCLLHENLPDEVAAFKPAFWPGELYLDKDLAFFAALGGGEVCQ